ncbi:MAG TPA: CHRD domain-containing protein [Blastocatellia bacterium]|jgi:hypothetical protein|nr:CHRD domain-containing protein [Blastocatellia bacterium]
MKRVLVSVLMMTLTMAAVMMSTMRSVKADTIVFTAQMLAANEGAAGVSVNPTETGATGQGIFTLDTTVSGGVITAATARFDLTLTGLASNSVVILTHIHEGAIGVSGPVRVDSGLTPAAPIPAAAGAVTFSRSGITVTPAQAQAIINNPGGFYFNSHTALSPGGVARGQLIRLQQNTGLAAPTLSEWGAILMTLLFVAMGVFFLVGRTRMAGAAAGGSSVVFGSSIKSIDWRLVAKVALYVEVIVGLALIALRAGMVDVMGALTSGLVVSFIIHLFIQSARQRKA